MNKQIRKLADQAVTRFDKDMDGSMESNEHGRWVPIDDLEKFAELIVRECAEVIKWTPSQFPNDEYVKNITEHFGIEE